MPFEVCFDGELSAGRVMIKVHCAFQQSRFTKLTTAVYDGCACHIPDGSEFTYAAKEHFISRRSGAVGKRLINCIRQCALQHCRETFVTGLHSKVQRQHPVDNEEGRLTDIFLGKDVFCHCPAIRCRKVSVKKHNERTCDAQLASIINKLGRCPFSKQTYDFNL